MIKINIFKTRDQGLAAYLHVRGYPLLHTTTVGNSVVFIFPPEAALSAEAFYSGAAVSAKNLLQAVRDLESAKAKANYEHNYI